MRLTLEKVYWCHLVIVSKNGWLICPVPRARAARGAWFTQTCLGKIDQLMLTKEVHWSTLIGTSTFQYRCNRKFENPIYMSVPRARGAWYFWIGWSDCLNQGTKRFVSIRAKSIAQITLPNCLLTTTNGQNSQIWWFLSYRSQIWGRRPLNIHIFGTQGARDINLVSKEPSHWVENHTTTFRAF